MTVSAPADVLEGQVSRWTCRGTVDSTGRVFLARSDREVTTGQYEEVVTSQVTTDGLDIDQCKRNVTSTFDLTFDMTSNSSLFRCETTSAVAESDSVTMMVIPGNS